MNSNSKDVSKLTEIDCSILYIDRYRVGSRSDLTAQKNNSKLEPSVIKVLQKDIKKATGKVASIKKIIAKKKIENHPAYGDTVQVLTELEKRIHLVEKMCLGETNEKVSRSDV
eukprot:UN22542